MNGNIGRINIIISVMITIHSQDLIFSYTGNQARVGNKNKAACTNFELILTRKYDSGGKNREDNRQKLEIFHV